MTDRWKVLYNQADIGATVARDRPRSVTTCRSPAAPFGKASRARTAAHEDARLTAGEAAPGPSLDVGEGGSGRRFPYPPRREGRCCPPWSTPSSPPYPACPW